MLGFQKYNKLFERPLGIQRRQLSVDKIWKIYLFIYLIFIRYKENKKKF